MGKQEFTFTNQNGRLNSTLATDSSTFYPQIGDFLDTPDIFSPPTYAPYWQYVPYYVSTCPEPDEFISDEQSTVTIQIPIPGGEKENFKISLENNVLTVNGQITTKNFLKKINKKFTLTGDIDSESIKAFVKNGILEIIVPKKVKVSNIPII